MLSAAAALVVALALGESKGTARAEARAALAASNAARARIGLLPRKAPARAGAAARGTSRFLPAPTFLGEPGTLAEAGERPLAARDPRTLRLSAHGVITDVTLSMRFDR